MFLTLHQRTCQILQKISGNCYLRVQIWKTLVLEDGPMWCSSRAGGGLSLETRAGNWSQEEAGPGIFLPLEQPRPRKLESQWCWGAMIHVSVSPKIQMLKPSPQSDGIRRWVTWRWWGYECGALMNIISDLIKATSGLPCLSSIMTSSTHCRGMSLIHGWRSSVCCTAWPKIKK